MSKQLNGITLYPCTRQTIRIVTDQQDFVSLGAENKIIVRTPDHWPYNKSTIHAHVKDGYGKITSVENTDPLVITTSGYTDLVLDGYDGLVVSEDGYQQYRGVIKTATGTLRRLYGTAALSVESHYFLLGGYEATDGYSNEIWHSVDGSTWERADDPPWPGRAHHSAISDGSGNVWLVGGLDSSGFTQEIWRGNVMEDTGELTWDSSAAFTNISLLNEYTKATYVPLLGGNYTRVGSGFISLSGGTEYDGSDPIYNPWWGDFGDAYGSAAHWDAKRNMWWWSQNGRRQSAAFSRSTNASTLNQFDFGFTHRQQTASTEWAITYKNIGGASGRGVVPVVYNDLNNITTPAYVTFPGDHQISLHFNTAVTGRAYILQALPYLSNESTWTVDGYEMDDSVWWICDDHHILAEPASVSRVDNDSFDVNWSTAQDGYIAVLEAWEADAITGRRYVATSSAYSSGSNSLTIYQADPMLFSAHDSNGNLIVPASVSADGTDTTFALNAGETATVGAIDMRHDGYHDLDDPWGAEFVSVGTNAKDSDVVYLLTSNGVWYSSSAGVKWERQNAEDVVLPNDRITPAIAEDGLVGGLQSDWQSACSLDFGDSFSSFAGPTEQTIEWYGALGGAIDTTHRLFAYKRPADVVWESYYGHLPGTIIDDYRSHYVLPYPAVINSANTQLVIITLDGVYDRSVTADEFVTDWLYLLLASTGEVVDQAEITGNGAAAKGGTLTLRCKALSTTPDTSIHRVQVIRRRPEGAIYICALTRNETLKYDVFHESGGTAFLADQERAYDYYAHLISRDGLPAYIATEDNLDRVNALHAELNRLRVAAGQVYNDPYRVPPELLERLAAQYGAAGALDPKTQRRATALWGPQVDAYGPCPSGLSNLIDIVLGPDSGVTVSLSDPNGDTLAGKVATVSLSNYADYTFPYGAILSSAYDSDIGKWGIAVSYQYINATLRSLIHRYMVHVNNALVDGPHLITQHGFSAGTAKVSIYFDDRTPLDFAGDNNSVYMILGAQKMRKVFALIQKINKMKPHYAVIKWS